MKIIHSVKMALLSIAILGLGDYARAGMFDKLKAAAGVSATLPAKADLSLDKFPEYWDAAEVDAFAKKIASAYHCEAKRHSSIVYQSLIAFPKSKEAKSLGYSFIQFVFVLEMDQPKGLHLVGIAFECGEGERCGEKQPATLIGHVETYEPQGEVDYPYDHAQGNAPVRKFTHMVFQLPDEKGTNKFGMYRCHQGILNEGAFYSVLLGRKDSKVLDALRYTDWNKHVADLREDMKTKMGDPKVVIYLDSRILGRSWPEAPLSNWKLPPSPSPDELLAELNGLKQLDNLAALEKAVAEKKVVEAGNAWVDLLRKVKKRDGKLTEKEAALGKAVQEFVHAEKFRTQKAGLVFSAAYWQSVERRFEPLKSGMLRWFDFVQDTSKAIVPLVKVMQDLFPFVAEKTPADTILNVIYQSIDLRGFIQLYSLQYSVAYNNPVPAFGVLEPSGPWRKQVAVEPKYVPAMNLDLSPKIRRTTRLDTFDMDVYSKNPEYERWLDRGESLEADVAALGGVVKGQSAASKRAEYIEKTTAYEGGQVVTKRQETTASIQNKQNAAIAKMVANAQLRSAEAALAKHNANAPRHQKVKKVKRSIVVVEETQVWEGKYSGALVVGSLQIPLEFDLHKLMGERRKETNETGQLYYGDQGSAVAEHLDEAHAKSHFDKEVQSLLVASGKTVLRKRLDALADSTAKLASGASSLDSLETQLIKFGFAGKLSQAEEKVLYPKFIFGAMNLEALK